MPRRFVTGDGRTRVDAISLSATGTGRDGEWLRVTSDGFFVGQVRSCRDLAKLVDLADLKEA
jgi:hypothetical protein